MSERREFRGYLDDQFAHDMTWEWDDAEEGRDAVSVFQDGDELPPVVVRHADDDAELLARIPEWRPIESAPRDGTLILIRWPSVFGDTLCLSEWDPEEGWGGDIDGPFPTHWMPLPGPPAPEEGEP